jgi:hypothetical protein
MPPAFPVHGQQIVHGGKQGMGASLKMVMNQLLGTTMAAFAEGLVLGRSLGLPLETLFEALLGGPAAAPFVAAKRGRIETGNFEDADFLLRWLQKDLHLASVSAYETGVSLPLTNVAKEIYRFAIREGDGDKDFSAIYHYLARNYDFKPASNGHADKSDDASARRGGMFMRMTVDETSRFDPTNQIDAVLSRRLFVKSAAVAAILGGASPEVLMAETKEGMPQRALGRTGEKVSAIGLGGYHIGKQADEAESIRIIRSAIDRGITFMDNCWDYNDGVSEIRMGKALRDGYRRRVFLMTKIDGRTKEESNGVRGFFQNPLLRNYHPTTRGEQPHN